MVGKNWLAKIMAILVGALLVSGGLSLLEPSESEALGSNCNAWIHTSDNRQQGQGKCSWVKRDTDVRVSLEINQWRDSKSDWFHETGIIHSTSWVQKWGNWQARSAKIDQKRR